MKVEIPMELINEWIRDYLSRNGIDLRRGYDTWVKYENESITFIYEQKENAEKTEEAKTEEELTKRPSYLDRS